MTSKEPTALEEIQARIDTLSKQIEQALSYASEAGDEVRRHNDAAARLALLRTGYLKVLEPVTGSTIIEVRGAIEDPTFVAEIVRRRGLAGGSV